MKRLGGRMKKYDPTFPKDTLVEFGANRIKLANDTTLESIKKSVSDMFEDIKVYGYRWNDKSKVLELRTKKIERRKLAGSLLIDSAPKGTKFYYPIKDVEKVLSLGVKKGDVLKLKGVGDFIVNQVFVGNKVATICVD
jgi:hypothetical protein